MVPTDIDNLPSEIVFNFFVSLGIIKMLRLRRCEKYLICYNCLYSIRYPVPVRYMNLLLLHLYWYKDDHVIVLHAFFFLFMVVTKNGILAVRST